MSKQPDASEQARIQYLNNMEGRHRERLQDASDQVCGVSPRLADACEWALDRIAELELKIEATEFEQRLQER